MLDFPTIVSYANIGYSEFAINMLMNLSKRAPNHRVHFYCLDSELFDLLTKRSFGTSSVTLELWTCAVSKAFEHYNSERYKQLTHQKVQILKDALAKYDRIHFIDSDVVCINEPTLEYYAHYAAYDIVFQFDCGYLPDKDIHSDHRYMNWVCTGNMTLRNTPGTHAILHIIEVFQSKFPAKNDQECLQKYFENFEITDVRMEQTARLYVYPPTEYVNGSILEHCSPPMEHIKFLHANHCIGSESKKRILNRIGEWYVE